MAVFFVKIDQIVHGVGDCYQESYLSDQIDFAFVRIDVLYQRYFIWTTIGNNPEATLVNNITDVYFCVALLQVSPLFDLVGNLPQNKRANILQAYQSCLDLKIKK